MKVATLCVASTFFVGAVVASSAHGQASEFQKTQLVGDEGAGQPNTLNLMEIEVAPDGRVFYTERRGVVGVWDPETETASEIGTVPVTTFQENGLMGIALAPDFETSGWIYLAYSALPLESPGTQRVSRFQLDENGDLNLASEQFVFEWSHLRETCCHSAGALEFDPDGNLLISTGDNTNPFESQGFVPIDERPGRESYDAQRTSANTNDHNGKLLRITPADVIVPGTEPGIGETYDIPAGNMFPVGTADTQPEIYAMGFRNPFRFKVDEETGWSLLADYGPDAGAGLPDRGPQGSVEYNVITEPGNFGWPYCVRQNTPYVDGEFTDPNNTFVSTGDPFDCAAPVNESPNNTGLTDLPAPEPATMWMGYSDTDARFPGLGTGGAPMAGPRYYFDPSNPSETKFPEEFDGKWFIAEWNNDWIKTAELDEDGNATSVDDFADLDYLSPMDMEFGPDGSLYVAEWGQGFGMDHPESGIYRIDHVELTAPQVTASADPDRGTVPLDVQFDGEATDPDGSPNPDFEYEWDFGDGSPVSTEEDPSHTYTEVGEYTATLTVTDPATEEEGTATVEIQVDPEDTCPTGPRSEEFDGTELDGTKWSVIRPDGTNPFSVSDGELHLPIDNGSIYGPGTSARNIIVQPLPDGEVSVTAKLSADALNEDYHQAGLRVYSDDDNWASVHMISAGGQRDFEFIWEADGNPRNEAADKLGGIPSDAPLEYYVRLISDGDELTAEYSYDGVTFLPVGRPGSLATFDNPRVGPTALSDAAPSVPMSHFDWIRFDPDAPGGGGDTVADEFDGADLESPPWETVRPNASLTVSGGALRIPAENGDLYGGSDTAQNLVLRDAPAGPWTATAEVNFEGDAQYHQAGILVYGDDANYTKLGRIAHTPTGDEKFEYIYETAGTPRNDAADSTPNVPEDFPDDYFVRITSDGTNITGAYSTDGTTWVPVGRPAPLPADARVGMFAFNNEAATSPEAAFERFELTSGSGGGSRSDQFDGDTLDTDRWNAIVNDNPEAYEVAGGQLTITTEPGDIYTGDTTPPPNNFILQSADHAEADWTIETKVLGGALDGGYSQGGLMAMQDTDNYVKFDLISDQDNPAVNRIELRSEVDAAIQEPQPQVTPLPAGTEDAWLRLTKAGESYTGEYSLDGETWTSIGEAVPNPMAAPDFGLFAFGAQQGGDEVGFDYFTLDGEVGGCPPGDNNPPVIDEIGATPTAGFAPLEVDFNAAASDPDDGDELSYSWDFGDGSPVSTEQNPSHTYTEAGEHEAELTVTDGEADDTDSVTVTVLAEDDPEARFRALAFSQTAGFRHSSIDEGHTALDLLAEGNDFQLDHSEDSSLFTEETLAAYDTVIFLSTTGDVLNEAQEDAFEAYIQGGGGYAGIHSASDTEYDWNWYGHLVGAYFISHPPGTANAAIDVEEHEHPSTAELPDRYERVDEWYNFKSPDFLTVGDDDYTPRGAADIHILARVDESTYDEQDGNATDDDHPVTWCQRYDGGRSWYTAMGHTEASFVEPNFLTQVLGGIETTAGVEPSATCGFEAGGETDLRLNVQPKRASVKVGKRATFRASVRNTGDAAADDVEVCAAAPRKLASIAGRDCVGYPSIAEAESETARFKVKAKRKAAGKKVTLRFTVRAANADRESAMATLKVKGKKKRR